MNDQIVPEFASSGSTEPAVHSHLAAAAAKPGDFVLLPDGQLGKVTEVTPMGISGTVVPAQ